jgi:hypothetical protein
VEEDRELVLRWGDFGKIGVLGNRDDFVGEGY